MILFRDDKGKGVLLNPAAILTIQPAAEGFSRIILMDGVTEYAIQVEFTELARDMSKLRYGFR